MGSPDALTILTPGGSEPPNLGVKNRKCSDFTQNDFFGRFRQFPTFLKKKKFCSLFGLDLENFRKNFKKLFSQKTRPKQIFELPPSMIRLSMGISMVAFFSRSDQKWPNGGHFSCQKCTIWPITQKVLVLAKKFIRAKLFFSESRVTCHQPFQDPIKNGRMAAILVAKNALFGP